MTTAPGNGVAPPTRLAAAFAEARSQGRKALVIYLTGSDPDFDTSRRLLLAASRAGADVLELGVPWSDPSADGPAIQAAMHRARASGGGMSSTLELCRAVRQADPDVGIVLFGYANPIVVRGTEAFAMQAKQAGADGVLCVDWPADEDPSLARALTRQGLDLIPLIAPTSTPERVKAAAAVAGGFLYYVSLTGITGSKLPDLTAAAARVGLVRELSGGRLPIAVGFGIATPADARAVAKFCDGVVVGSAAVRTVERAQSAGRDPVAALEAFVADLRGALGRG
jgi:tryptophan synthase alpha chain